MAETSSLTIDPNWDDILSSSLPPAVKLTDIVTQCHLVFSLILYLKLSLRELIWFIFESNIPIVKQRAGLFMAHKDSWATPFAPARLFSVWLTRWPRSKPYLLEMIKPCIHDTILEESNKIIGDPQLKIKTKTLTMHSIRHALDPARLAAHYKSLAPFLWDILLIFTTSPNKSRKQRDVQKAHRARKAGVPVDEGEDEIMDVPEGDIYDEDEGGEEPEGMGGDEFVGETGAEWKSKGFDRNVTFVGVVFVLFVSLCTAADDLFCT